MVAIVCTRCGMDATAKRRPAKFCPGCRAEVRREVNARSDRKNRARVRAASKRWREQNRDWVREQERQRRRPSRAEYARRRYWDRRLNKIAASAAPRWAVAAAEVKRAWLALPSGPVVDEESGPCCAVACVPQRKFVGGFCLECGESFIACQDRGDRFCSVLCGKRYGRRQRRARKIAAFVEPVYRRRVFERDGWRCQLCKRLVSKTASVPHPRAATIDHIVPLAEGGEHAMANVHTAHFMCNSQKGAQARDEQLRLVG